MSQEGMVLVLVFSLTAFAVIPGIAMNSSTGSLLAFAATASPIFAVSIWALCEFKTPVGRKNREIRKIVSEIPVILKVPGEAVYMGQDRDLRAHFYLPNSVRLKHTHILGATGSGKTESVILNFLKQDICAGHGAIILDGKGDNSFLEFLRRTVPEEKLRVFDLSSAESCSFSPLADGSKVEAAQRLFSSLNWSEEYYKSKALTALQRIFRAWPGTNNPSIPNLSKILSSSETFADAVAGGDYSVKNAQADYKDISGLRDQIELLCSDYLRENLRDGGENSIKLHQATHGTVIYFRLQSLLSRQLASTMGRLVINNLSYLAGSSHRRKGEAKAPFIPTYLDEFAIFACPEFADLIAKARSAGLALHFSHQSIGDLDGVQPGFLNQLIDNTATKIVMRVNDPDTAELFAKAFGTFETGQLTQRVSNAKDIESAHFEGAGSLREVKEFRMHPDAFKSLPVGAGAVLIAHGQDVPGGATSVFKIQFPKL